MPNIQETLSHAIKLLGPEVIRTEKSLINAIEDLNPTLTDDIKYLKKVYEDDIGERLYQILNGKSSKDACLQEVSVFLMEEYGFNENWRKRFLTIFMFIFDKRPARQPSMEPAREPAVNLQRELVKQITLAEDNRSEDEKFYEYAKTCIARGETKKAIDALLNIFDGGEFEAKAHLLLGNIFDETPERSFVHYLRAAKLGEPRAQFLAGYMYEKGEGTDKNIANAIAWYKKAADAGNRGAQHNLAYFYYEGIAVRQSYENAFKYYSMAAAQGKADSMRNLGIMYEYGQYVSEDVQEAQYWYQKAVANGDSSAENDLKRLARHRHTRRYMQGSDDDDFEFGFLDPDN